MVFSLKNILFKNKNNLNSSDVVKSAHSSYFKSVWKNFKSFRRAYLSLWIFSIIFIVSLFSEFIANDRPLFMYVRGYGFFAPVFKDYSETDFGGELPTAADYNDPWVRNYISDNGFAVWPLIKFDYKAINYDVENPSGASLVNILGTDDHGRDVFARLLYAIRFSILFAFSLVIVSSFIGILLGVATGYFAGKFDLWFQRFVEVWNGLPQMFVLIIAMAMFAPSFWSLLFVLTLFSWTSLLGVARAEALKVRNQDYVLASRVLGLSNIRILFKHILPNSLTAVISYLPFALVGAIGSLTALDFLGIGMPAGSASIGDILKQGKENLEHPLLALSGFVVISGILVLLIFIGEGVRYAIDTSSKKNK